MPPDPAHALGPNLRGALLMCAGMAAFAASDACMKALGEAVPLAQAILLRGLGVTAALALLAWSRGVRLSDAGPRDRRLMGLRALCEVWTAWTYLSALMLMPVANVSAVFQASPIVMAVAGWWLLGERVRPRRWAAIAVGFAGVLVILRPGGVGWGGPTLLVLLSVVGVTLRDLVARRIDAAVPSVLVAAVTGAVVTATGALASLGVDWRPLAMREALLLLGAQGALVLGYLGVVAGMRTGEVSFVAPFRYASLLASLATGWLVFGTFPDPLTLVGAGIVVAGGVAMVASARADPRGEGG